LSSLTGREFHGPNLGYVLELYEEYRRDPAAVDEELREFFEGWVPGEPAADGVRAGVDVEKVVAAARYFRCIRDFGHTAARLDPLGSEPAGDPTLDPEFHGITEGELENLPATIPGGPVSGRVSNAREAARELRRIYCGTTGYDFSHIYRPEERTWLRDAVESERFKEELQGEDALRLLRRLTRVDTFEKYLHRTFLGQKRFSVEGTDVVVPMLNTLVRAANEAEIPEVVMGMAHRGRLNVLAHVLNKPYQKIFGEFEQKGGDSAVSENEGQGWVGDVKYHLGIRGFYLEDGEEDSKVLINLAPNPSHLEHVNPVVEGLTRAAQEKRDAAGPPERSDEASMTIVLHGDAAFPGEGIVAETLNLSRLPGYTTGGTIHIIINNQLGFTTEPSDARSTNYASDLAKGFEIPVVHVNADDPEACLAAARMAWAYRETFHKDFMIDLIGYRRWGHNEGDEPAFTQPEMYEKIRNHPPVRQIYARKLEERGIINAEEAERIAREFYERMDEIRKGSAEEDLGSETIEEPYTPLAEIPETGVPVEKLLELNRSLLELPEGFNPEPKLWRLMQKNRGGLDEEGRVDWAHAEALAFASLLADGVPIRLTGQDTERGTFSQRHSVLHDVKTGGRHVPLQALPQARASFAVHNSPLTEAATLGFEYGYSLNAPEALVLWEAQYGDFANVGQAIIDQFISSGHAKWGQSSGLTLLLPHGYEGQGPEHSSARLERYLQLCARENMRVANCTTAAQYFHLLRCQAALLRENPRPLVLMTPKSLLRHPASSSHIRELAEGRFRPVIDDPKARDRRDSVRRLVLCSGKIYVDMDTSDHREEAEDVAIARVELLYPFPEEELARVIDSYPNLREIVWVQEEPRNMGAWFFMEPRLRQLVGGELPISYIGKPARPAPAQGSARFHAREQAGIVRAAFDNVKSSREREVRSVG
jgi:2-oxoglutarate dehydrogenase E1 component